MVDAPPRPQVFLVVDDSLDMRFVVARIVRRIHPEARVEEARDASEALERLRHAGEGASLVVVSDYDMGPGLSGIQLLEEVARRHPHARRILLTGHGPDRIAPAGCELHAVLPKEMGLQALQACLQAMVAPEAGTGTGRAGGLRLPGASEGAYG